MTTDRRSDDDPPRSGLLGAIRALLEMLAEMDDRGESVRRGEGYRRRGPFGVDVDYDVGIGSLDAVGRPEPPDRGDSPETDDSPIHTTIRRDDGGYRVVADLPPDLSGDVSADLDPETGVFTLLVDEAPVARLPLSADGLRIADVTTNNRVVDVGLVPTEEDR